MKAKKIETVFASDRKEAKGSFQKSEKKIRSIFSAAPAGIGVVVHRVFTEVNERFCEMTGYTRDEVIGQSARMIYASDADYEYVGREKYDQMAQRGTGTVETHFRHKDGTVIDVLLSSTPIDTTNLSRGVIFTALDVTTHKRTEEALKQRIEELAALSALGRAVNASLSFEETMVTALSEMMNAVHPDISFFFLRQGEKLILKQVLPMSERTRLEAIPEHRVGECMCGLAVKEKKPQYSINIFNDPRCTWEDCKRAGLKSIAVLPLRNGEEVIGVIGLASEKERDYERQAEFLETLTSQVSVALANARLFEIAQLELAERKRAELAARESEARYRNIFEHAIEGIFQSTPDGHYVTVNPSFARMFGFDSPEQMIASVTDISSLYTHPEDRQEILHLLKTVGEVKHFQAELKRRDGKHIWISINARAVRDDKQHVLFFEGTVEDITDRKQAEEQLHHVLSIARCILWHAVVTDSPEGGVHWDLQIANEEAAEKMFPIPRKPGQRYSDVWRNGTPLEDIERMDHTSIQAMREGKTGYAQEFRLSLPSGEIRWLSEDARIQSLEPRCWLVVGVCTDITERKRVEEALQQQMDELRRWHQVTLGRETRVLDLKREVNELLAKMGQPPRYESVVTSDRRKVLNRE